MTVHVKLGNMAVEVVQKDIKHVHLSVYPPTGKVRISAPLRMNLDTIRVFAVTKLESIKKQQDTLRKQDREPPREYLDRESHYFLGRRYLLRSVGHKPSAGIALRHSVIAVHQRGAASPEKARSALQNWYRAQTRRIGSEYIAKWEPRLGVKVAEFGIKAMKTKWGTCNPLARRIWLNLELAKKPVECLEYIVVHEMVHILERNHSDKFVKIMDEHMPKWKFLRQELNRSPLKHESWTH